MTGLHWDRCLSVRGGRRRWGDEHATCIPVHRSVRELDRGDFFRPHSGADSRLLQGSAGLASSYMCTRESSLA